MTMVKKKRVVKKVVKTKKVSAKKKIISVKKKITSIKKASFVKKTAVKKKNTKAKKSKKKILSKKQVQILRKKSLSILKKFIGNPIMEPIPNSSWEGQAVFNPAAVVHGGRIHLIYRALGSDGMSRFGYVSGKDGIDFKDRCPYPVYIAEKRNEAASHYPHTSPARLMYDPNLYASGGGWGGCEDPRTVKIDGRIYMTFNMFNGWNSMRVAFTSIDADDLAHKRWNWDPFMYLSRPGDRQKNWVLFPEKINGKFALFHNLDKGDSSRVSIKYMNKLHMSEAPTQAEAPDPHILPDHNVVWHNRTRSAAAPPIKTKDGWLLFYHAMDREDPNRYKVGAMLLDLADPTRVLYRAPYPLIQPDEWYENDWKPGVVYMSGAVVKDGTLFLYYGGGDKRIAVAYVKLDEFLKKLKNKENAVFTKKSIKI